MKKRYVIGVVLLLLLVGWGYWRYVDARTPGQFDALAKCISAKGAVFYGTFWCPNCANQKTLFGKSAKYLNYVECSTPDGRQQLPACSSIDVKAYPTWIFADGSRQVGTMSLFALADRTGCTLDGESEALDYSGVGTASNAS